MKNEPKSPDFLYFVFLVIVYLLLSTLLFSFVMLIQKLLHGIVRRGGGRGGMEGKGVKGGVGGRRRRRGSPEEICMEA